MSSAQVSDAVDDLGAVPVAAASAASAADDLGAKPVDATPPQSAPSIFDAAAELGATEVHGAHELGAQAIGSPIPAPPSAQEKHLRETNTILPSEIDALAARHPGSDADTLKSVAPYLGAFTGKTQLERAAEVPKRLLGMAGRAGLNIPQFLAKKLANNEATQKAWDELQELADSRHTTGGKVLERSAEFAGGMQMLPGGAAAQVVEGGAISAIKRGGVVAAAKLLGEGAAGGAAIGAAAHVANSKTGQETKGVGFATGVGAAIGTVLHLPGAAGKLLSGGARDAAREIAPAVDEALQQPAHQAESVAGLANVHEAANPTGPATVRPWAHVAEATRVRLADPAALAEAAEASPALLEAHGAEGLVEHLAQREAQQAAHADLTSFAGWLKGGMHGVPEAGATGARAATKAADYVAEWTASGNTEEGLTQAYGHFKAVQATQRVFAEAVARQEVTPGSAIGNFFRSFARAPSMMGIIDDRSVSQLEPLVNRMGTATGEAMSEAFTWLKGLKEHLETLNQAGLSRLSPEERAAVEAGDTSGFSREAQAALGHIQRFSDNLLGRVNEKLGGKAVTAAEGVVQYWPRIRIDNLGIMRVVRGTAREAEKAGGIGLLDGDISEATLATLRRKAPEAWRELGDQLQYLTQSRPETAVEVQAALKRVLDPNGVSALLSARDAGRVAGLALQRGEQGIPSSLLEQDIARSWSQYTVAALRDAHTREPLRAFAAEVGKLEAAGDTAGAKYARTWLLDQVGGGQAKVPAWMARQRAASLSKAFDKADRLEAAGDNVSAAMLRGVANNSDLGRMMVQSMYPSLLGWNPRTIMKALTTPITTMAPELAAGGNAWGVAKVMGGAAKAVQQLAAEPVAAMRSLVESGWMPKHLSQQLVDPFQAGLQHSLPGKFARQAVESLGQASLTGLQFAEGFSRLIGLHAADSVTTELMQGAPEATRWLDQIGRGAAYRIRQAVTNGDAAEVQRLVREDFVTKTVHQYTPLHMNEVGRQWGRIVGALSTWPSALATNVARDYLRRGEAGLAASVLRKYAAPYAVLHAAQHMASAGGWDPEKSPGYAAVVGKHGLAGASPVGDLKLSGGPMLSDAYQTLGAVAKGDPAGFYRGANALGEHYGFGANAWVRLAELMLGRHPAPRETITGRAMDVVKPGSGQSMDEYVKDRYGSKGDGR